MNQLDKYGKPLIMAGISRGSPKIVELLLKYTSLDFFEMSRTQINLGPIEWDSNERPDLNSTKLDVNQQDQTGLNFFQLINTK